MIVYKIRMIRDKDAEFDDDYEVYAVYINDEQFLRDDSSTGNFMEDLVNKYGKQYNLDPDEIDFECMESYIELRKEDVKALKDLVDDYNNGKLKKLHIED